ncbi:hypothetical protein [Streptomyces sp. NPDC093097]|uniref:hypothetical protein n=1 Tax=Streptomyces sp. NPDC093097 TaxID=3366027 RepID=UPI0038231060
MSSELHQRLAAAQARTQHGNAEIAAAADDRAHAIADEVARRGRGGARQVAEELNMSEAAVSQAVARARRAKTSPTRTLPPETLERLLTAELTTLEPLSALQWQALTFIVRGIFIDISWIEQPGQLLASEVEDAELPAETDPQGLAATCHTWTRTQALAVIDACQRDDIADLPVVG